MLPPLALLLLVPAALGARDHVRRDVRYPSGEIRLAAELLHLPDLGGPRPGAVVLQGSGDSDRSNGWSRAIAEVLAERGLVVLLTDKRGCGASEGTWTSAGIGELADDALAGVAFLRSLPEVEADRVGVVGLSQGGWVAPVAAARSADVAWVVDVSGAAVGFVEQTAFEMRNTAREAGLDEAGVAVVAAMSRAVHRYVASGDWGAYAAAREEALATPARSVVEGFPGRADDPRWTFFRRMLPFDPLPYWSSLEQPALVLYGAEDERDNVPVAESVRRLESAFATVGKRNGRIVVVPGAGHGFLDERGLMPAFVDALGTWIEATVDR